MKPARAVAFAAEELFPFGPGGIGRLVHHLVRQALAEGIPRVHLFLPASLGARTAEVQALFGPAVTASTFDASAPGALARSHALARHVAAHCAAHDAYDWIELPDFRGLGFATLQLGATVGLRHEPALRVRVHGPNTLIAWHEQERLDDERATQFELERQALTLADLVIAPSVPVRDAVATFFRLGEGWRRRVTIALPPRGSAPDETRTPPAGQDVIFPTKFQRIKRPDLFVAGASALMRRRPAWRGRAILAAHRNEGVEAPLFRELPAAQRARFEWAPWSAAERAEHFAGQVVVVPSDFETLSLAAWEAAAVGARVVGSTRCPAFMEGSPWAAWPGFHGFDGTLEGLVAALERALDAPVPGPLSAPAGPLPRPTAAKAASPGRWVEPRDVAVAFGDLEAWSRAVAQAEAPWILLARHAEEVAVAPFVEAAARALSRRPRASVITTADALASMSRAWAAPPQGAPVVAPTELARRIISPSCGRRGLLATALQLELECLGLFTEARPGDVEPFPPLYLDAHPFALRLQRDLAPPLKQQVLERAMRMLPVLPGLRRK